MHKWTVFLALVTAAGVWMAPAPIAAVPKAGSGQVSYSLAALSGAPLVQNEFEAGRMATRVVHTGPGELEMQGRGAGNSAPKNSLGLDRSRLVLCGSSDDCALGTYEVSVRLPTKPLLAKPLLGFGTPPRPVADVSFSTTFDLGVKLIASTARLIALPLVALALGVAIFSIGGPGTPLFDAQQLARRRRAKPES